MKRMIGTLASLSYVLAALQFSGFAFASTAPLSFGTPCPSGQSCSYSGSHVDFGTFKMSCSGAGTLSVQSSSYGVGTRSESCASYIDAQCNGDNWCSITFNPTNCGGDPDFGTPKNGSVTVACAQPAVASPMITQIHTAYDANVCMDIFEGSTAPGYGVDIFQCNVGDPHETFAFVPQANGYYKIQPQNGGNLCLDSVGKWTWGGTQAVQNPCSGAISQQWKVLSNANGSYSILTQDGQSALEVEGGESTANRTAVLVWPNHGDPQAQFKLPNFVLPSTALKGNIDGFYYNSSGIPVLSGWVCQEYNTASIQTNVYLGGPYGSGTFVPSLSVMANQPSELAIAAACNTVGSNFRFSIPIPAAMMTQYAQNGIYVYGLSSTSPTLLLQGSGLHQVPAAAGPANTPVPIPVTQSATAMTPIAATPVIPVAPFAGKIGMFYSLWHCPLSSSTTYNPSGTIYDISKILSGLGSWGPIPDFHWWGQPDAGYYCLAENDALLTQHAQMLSAAGIDFVYLDVTNWPTQAGGQTMIIDPLNELIKVWSQIPNAPKIVPWIQVTVGSDMANYISDVYIENPDMTLSYQGKPLLLVATSATLDTPWVNYLQDYYTIRIMGGLLNSSQMQSSSGSKLEGDWSFMQPCANETGFKGAQANQVCNQLTSMTGGAVEQVPVATAYQADYMSDFYNATPKFLGKTFLRQLETAYNNPTAPTITITGWNEWIAQRGCIGGGPCNSSNETDDGNMVFTDEYDVEYSRDMEPGGGMGNYYYNLLQQAIALYRAGQNPMAALPVSYGSSSMGASSGNAAKIAASLPSVMTNLGFSQMCPVESSCYYSQDKIDFVPLTMSCASGQQLLVSDAQYGISGATESCSTYLAQACSGKSSCQFSFSPANCGRDPDPGVAKSGNVSVSCVEDLETLAAF